MAYNYIQEGAIMFSPHFLCCPPHNTHTLQFSQDQNTKELFNFQPQNNIYFITSYAFKTFYKQNRNKNNKYAMPGF